MNVEQGRLVTMPCMKELTCNGSPAAEEDLLGHWVIRWGAELGHHDGQHQVLSNLLALLAVAQLQVRHIWEGRHTCHLQCHLHHYLLCSGHLCLEEGWREGARGGWGGCARGPSGPALSGTQLHTRWVKLKDTPFWFGKHHCKLFPDNRKGYTIPQECSSFTGQAYA